MSTVLWGGPLLVIGAKPTGAKNKGGLEYKICKRNLSVTPPLFNV